MKKLDFILVLILALVLSACGSSVQTPTGAPPTEAPTQEEARPIPEILITAQDYSFTAPFKTGAGWVRVILKNSGTEPHHVQFLRLNDGVTSQQFQDALAQGEGPALAFW